MTEFVKTCKRLEGLSFSLNKLEKIPSASLDEVQSIATELEEEISLKINRFRSRLEDPDPSKRTYGPTMEVKVKDCLKKFDELQQRVERVRAELTENYSGCPKPDQESPPLLAKATVDEEAKLQEYAERKREKEEAELLRIRKIQETVLQETIQQREIFLRRQERERVQWAQRELEARQAVDLLRQQDMRQLQEQIATRRKKEEARDEKRRRLGNILEQHRQVKGKGEKQLIAEAIALSLREATKEEQLDQDAASSESKAETAEPESQKKKEPAGPPPPSDLETEDMLIKKAIELSLQFSPPLADHCSGSSRRDKTPDAQSP